MSADNQTSNCEVYVDVNDQKPFQNATITDSGGANYYSTWTYIYRQILSNSGGIK
jgi:hypothetical protein